jgi:hypothetical protein
MTIPTIRRDDNKLHFNPLIPLNSSKINKVPEDIRKKQFFNEGLFESLLNFMNVYPAKNIEEVTRKGYVDKNIQITLHTLFPEDSIMYIHKSPYVISDFQWRKGDWKIEEIQTKNNLDNLGRKNNPRYNAYNNPYFNSRYREKEETKHESVYSITIDMELYPGTTLTPQIKKEVKCRNKWNAVRKSYSEFTGKPYIIRPIYSKTVKNNKTVKTVKTMKNKKTNTNNTNTRKNR